MHDRGAVVGVVHRGYNEVRNFAYLGQHAVDLVDVPDRVATLRKLWHRTTGVGYAKTLHSVSWPHRSKMDVLHTFNAVAFGDVPWVVTFETTLPRASMLPAPVKRVLWKRLAADQCLAILALSSSAYRRILYDLSEDSSGVDRDVVEAIHRKLHVLHPPQAALLSPIQKMGTLGYEGPLRLAVIGDDFYRKGGLELLESFSELVESGMDVRLTIVGGMRAGDYASRAGTVEEDRARFLIAKHAERVYTCGRVQNGGVLEMLRETHILCLPTWGDTYGYSVLEGQAMSCATITTDLRALPEINNEACGWVIAVPKLPSGDAEIGTSSLRSHFRTILIEGLTIALREAHDNRELLRAKAAQAYERIRRYHDPARHSSRLREIYSTRKLGRG